MRFSEENIKTPWLTNVEFGVRGWKGEEENEGGSRRGKAGSDRGQGEEKMKASGETKDRGGSKGAYRGGCNDS